MYSCLEGLASLGPRHSGSMGDVESLRRLEGAAAELGLDVWRSPVDVVAFEPGGATLTILEPEPLSLRCLPQDRTSPTPPEGSIGEVAYVGVGREEDYAGVDASGKVVLLETWGLQLRSKLEIATSKGAISCVLVNNQPCDEPAAWALGGTSEIPVVGISSVDARALLKRMGEREVVVRLQVSSVNHPSSSYHLFAESPADNGKAEGVVLVAHRDTTHVSPGANDNGSGIAVVLEVLGALRGEHLPFAVTGIFSAAEEGGGCGIRSLVHAGLPGFRHKTLAAINLDMVAVGSRLNLVRSGARLDTSEVLNQVIQLSARELGYRVDTYDMPMGLADAGPFIEAGIHTSWLYKPDDLWFHTGRDMPDHVNPNDLKVAADIVAATLLKMAENWETYRRRLA